MSAPALSVVMPVHNAERYLRAAIQSITRQTFGDFEFIIVDDGSTDGSLAIIEELASADARIRVMSQANSGAGAARNRAVGVARGDLVAMMDADDISLLQRFAVQMQVMKDDPEVVVVGSYLSLMRADGAFIADYKYPVSDDRIRRSLHMGFCSIANATVIMRRAAFDRAGGYNEKFRIAEDYDLWLRVSEGQGKFANAGQALYKYRIYAGSSTYRFADTDNLNAAASLAFFRMRTDGLAEPSLGPEGVTKDLLRTLPLPYRPSEAKLLELEKGPPWGWSAADIAEAAVRLAADRGRRECHRPLARTLFRAGCGALRRGKPLLALRTVLDSLRFDPLVGLKVAWTTAASVRRGLYMHVRRALAAG